jgi:hypothetical protein
MFCPNCGVHQTGDRRFCPSCGQNLAAISQAMSGSYVGPAAMHPGKESLSERRRQYELSKGVKLTIIGGAFLAIQFFGFIFSIPFRSGGTPFGFFSFVALVLMAVGVSKLVNARPVTQVNRFTYPSSPPPVYQQIPPQPAVVQDLGMHPDAPPTGELIDSRHPASSVTEDDTQHLPHNIPPNHA